MEVKKCKCCGEVKYLNEFFKGSNKDGLHSWCKLCCKSNPKRKSSDKKYYRKNKEKITEYRKSKSKSLKEYHKKYYQENRDKCLESVKNHQKHNSDRYKNYWREYRNKRRILDLEFRLVERIRGMVYRTQSQIKTSPNFSSSMLNYTSDMLKQRLEVNFKEGMSWENYGEIWEIDHKKPISLFIEQDKNDPFIINCLANLQPLFIFENRKKSNKWIS